MASLGTAQHGKVAMLVVADLPRPVREPDLRQELARVQQPARIQKILEPSHDLDLVRGSGVTELVRFEQPDPVFC